jgi:hypothetical protein
MTKTMCKKSKEDLDKISSKEPLFRCKKCDETAHKEKHLCKPKKI